MMHVELIKRLRECTAEQNGEKTLWHQAADAIEELEKKLREEKVDNVNLTGWLAEEHAKHLWIPVTERLPDVFKHVLVNIPGMAPHPTVQEGFREKNGMWYLNGFRYEADDITHWMLLPQPPKDGEA